MTAVENINQKHCPSCSSQTFHNSMPYPGGEKEGRSIIFCKNCGLGLMHPAYTKEELEQLYNGGNYWKDQVPNPRIQEIALPYVLAQSRWNYIVSQNPRPLKKIKLLDIGAGFGCLGMVAASQLNTELELYTAVEADHRILEALKKNWGKFGNHRPLSTASDLAQITGQYDIIVLSHVLEHFTEPDLLLKPVQKLLSPDGSVFVEVPNNDHLFKKDVSGHALFFGPQQLKLLLLNLGFSQVHVQVFGRTASTKQNMAQTMAEKFIHKTKTLLPYGFLAAFYQRLFGFDAENPEGIWIRALAKTSQEV